MPIREHIIAGDPGTGLDRWFKQQDRAVERLHRSQRRKRHLSGTIDEVERDRRVTKRVAENEKKFIDAVVLARAIARLRGCDDGRCFGCDLVEEAFGDLPEWFREMHARYYSEMKQPEIPGRTAAFADHAEEVKLAVQREMQAELEAAKDTSELEKLKADLLADEMDNFADALESARLMFRDHRNLVTATRFPEPYRTLALMKNGFDPEKEELKLPDLHITDPEADEVARDVNAREILAERNRMAKTRR